MPSEIIQKKLIPLLEEMAALLELKGESPFKCRAYANAARTLGQFDGNLLEAIADESLLKEKGIGQGMFQKLTEWAATGTFSEYERAKAAIPSGLFEMLKLRGLGVKKVRSIYENLNITNLGDLEYACIENRLTDLPGFGKKIQNKIQEEIALHNKHRQYVHCHTARALGEELLAQLHQVDGVVRASFAGELRRRNEIVQCIDLMVGSNSPQAVKQALPSFGETDDVEVHGHQGIPSQTGIISDRYVLKGGIKVHLNVVPDDLFPFLLHHYTGSNAYLSGISEHARRYGIRISDYGLFLDDHLLPCKNESEIFSTLGLEYIPPELREGQGEIEAAAKHALPRLVKREDIRGVFHIHTTYSDGSASLFQMVEAAEREGFEYIGISDHSQSAFYANGLKADRVRKQHQEIDALRRQFKKIHIFKGIESDILPDGRLDYDDEILAAFDFVIASVHSHFNMAEEEMTRRIVRAMRHPAVTILGHPTGRLLLSREGYPLSIPDIIEAARINHVAIEVNASPHRLDLDWRHCKLAKEAGVRLSLNPDAHQVEAMADLASGLGIARKGWLTSDDLLNTLPQDQVVAFLKGGAT